MAAELTAEGASVWLEQGLKQLNATYEVMLFGSFSASRTSTYSDFAAQEITGTDYARISVDPSGWIVSGADATYPSIVFIGGDGGWGEVAGYCVVTNEASPRSVWFQLEDTPLTINTNAQYGVNLSELVG